MNVEPQVLVDPVCLMSVDLDHARSIGLTAERYGITYAFCAKGCKLDFLDSPAAYGAAAAEVETGQPGRADAAEIAAQA